MQNMKLVTNKFKSGGLHEKHVVATGNLGNHLMSSHTYTQSNQFLQMTSEKEASVCSQ